MSRPVGKDPSSLVAPQGSATPERRDPAPTTKAPDAASPGGSSGHSEQSAFGVRTDSCRSSQACLARIAKPGWVARGDRGPEKSIDEPRLIHVTFDRHLGDIFRRRGLQPVAQRPEMSRRDAFNHGADPNHLYYSVAGMPAPNRTKEFRIGDPLAHSLSAALFAVGSADRLRAHRFGDWAIGNAPGIISPFFRTQVLHSNAESTVRVVYDGDAERGQHIEVRNGELFLVPRLELAFSLLPEGTVDDFFPPHVKWDLSEWFHARNWNQVAVSWPMNWALRELLYGDSEDFPVRQRILDALPEAQWNALASQRLKLPTTAKGLRESGLMRLSGGEVMFLIDEAAFTDALGKGVDVLDAEISYGGYEEPPLLLSKFPGGKPPCGEPLRLSELAYLRQLRRTGEPNQHDGFDSQGIEGHVSNVPVPLHRIRGLVLLGAECGKWPSTEEHALKVVQQMSDAALPVEERPPLFAPTGERVY